MVRLFHSGLFHRLLQPISCASGIGVVFRPRTDARNSEKLEQLFSNSGVVLREVFIQIRRSV